MREASFGGTRSKRRLRSLAALSVSPRHVRGAREAERRERARERGARETERERERAHQAPRAIEAESTESFRDAVAEPHYERHADDTGRAIKRRPSSVAAKELEDRLASAEEDIRASKSDLDIAYNAILRIPEGKGGEDAAIVEFVRHHGDIELAYHKIQELGVRAARLEDIRKAHSDTQAKKHALHNRFVSVIQDATTRSVDGHALRAALAYDDATTGGTSPYRRAYDAFVRESEQRRAAVEAEIAQQAQQAEKHTQEVQSALARLTKLKAEVRGLRGEGFYDDSIRGIEERMKSASQLLASIRNANPTQQQIEDATALLRKMETCHTQLREMQARAAGYAQLAKDLGQEAKLIAQNSSGSGLEGVREKMLEILSIRNDISRIDRDDRHPGPYIDHAIDVTDNAIERLIKQTIDQTLQSPTAVTGEYEETIRLLRELERTAASFSGEALEDAVLRMLEAKRELEVSFANSKNDTERAHDIAQQAKQAARGAKDGDTVALIAELLREVSAITVDDRYSEGGSTILDAKRTVEACLSDVQAPKSATPDAAEEAAGSLRPGLPVDSGKAHEEATPSVIATPIATSAKTRAAAKKNANRQQSPDTAHERAPSDASQRARTSATATATSAFVEGSTTRAPPALTAATATSPSDPQKAPTSATSASVEGSRAPPGFVAATVMSPSKASKNTRTSRTTVSTIQLSEAPAPVKDRALKLENALKFVLQPPSDVSQEARASVTSASVQATETDATKQARQETLAEPLERRVKKHGDQRADTGDAATSPSTGSNIRPDTTGVGRAKPDFLADIKSRNREPKDNSAVNADQDWHETRMPAARLAFVEHSASKSVGIHAALETGLAERRRDMSGGRDDDPEWGVPDNEGEEDTGDDALVKAPHAKETEETKLQAKIQEAELELRDAEELHAAAIKEHEALTNNVTQKTNLYNKVKAADKKKTACQQKLKKAKEDLIQHTENAAKKAAPAKQHTENETQTVKIPAALHERLAHMQQPEEPSSDWDSDFGSTRRRGAMFV